MSNNRGIVLILVISVLAVLLIFVTGLIFMVKFQMRGSQASILRIKGKYIAEAGVSHALEIIKSDKNQNVIDINTDVWRSTFEGPDVDNDDDGSKESKWIEVTDEGGNLIGRYAVLVTDESSKVNINTAGSYNHIEGGLIQGWSPYEVDLASFFTNCGASDGSKLALYLLDYRHGGESGLKRDRSGVDDDNDGLIDEDGRPGIDTEAYDDDSTNAFLSTDDIDNDADGFVDEDNEGMDDPGEFHQDDPYGDDRPFVTSEQIKEVKGVTEGTFDSVQPKATVYSEDIPTDMNGKVRLDVNEVKDPQTLAELLEDKGIPAPTQLAVNIVDYKDFDHAQSSFIQGGVTYYGNEAVKINELMVKPVIQREVTPTQNPGGGWFLVSDHYENSTPGQGGEGSWTWTDIPDGTYYLKVYGTTVGQNVGDVRVGGATKYKLDHGDYFSQSASQVVDVSGNALTISIKNEEAEGVTTYFKYIELSQSPDCEYVELVNLSKDDIDISGWSIQFPDDKNTVASIPLGTALLRAGGYIALCVDKGDSQSGLSGNEISFEDIFGTEKTTAQLSFADTITISSDFLRDSQRSDGNVVTLRDTYGHIVDRAEYIAAQAAHYKSFEKSDPTYVIDSNSNSYNDYWEYSAGLLGGSPSEQNQNSGLAGHSLNEISIKDGLLANIGEIVDVPTGGVWNKLSTADLAKVVDSISTLSLRLEAAGHGVQLTDWNEVERPQPEGMWFESTTLGAEGIFKWDKEDRLIDGTFILNVYGVENEAIQVALKLESGSWTDYTPPLTLAPDGGARYGVIDIGQGTETGTPSQTLEIKVKNDSISQIAHFNYITLSPILNVQGRVNINTASREVLKSLPGIDDTIADSIIQNRPYGDKEFLKRGIGDLLTGTILGETEDTKKAKFEPISNLLTVKSNVFRITATGQALKGGTVISEGRISTIVER